MPHVIITASASVGIDRCLDFLSKLDAAASRKAAAAISRHFRLLETNPAIGRPRRGTTSIRELSIPFGRAGYVVLYRHDPEAEAVYVLAFRHQREAGYGGGVTVAGEEGD